ncbi:MAG: magnesium/cobalt transporter CorA [Parachlamydiaceae bacterium]|nr:magnesium/cobalt transporter CorA [Parachlamydiaceae bacterium]
MIRFLRKKKKKHLEIFPSGVVEEKDKLNKIKVSIVEYTDRSIIEKDNVSLTDCLGHLHTPPMTWIQVNGVDDNSIITTIAKHFQIHALALEDILHNQQRPKLDVYEDQLFIVVRLLIWDEKLQELLSEQVSLIVGPSYLISFSDRELPLFETIKVRLRKPNNRLISQGTDFLAYTILDAIIDQYFVVLEHIDSRLEDLEEELVSSPSANTLHNIQNAKRTMIFLRRSIWPLRDVISRFQHLEAPYVSSTTQIYLSDIYDHVIQLIDIIEGFRDVVSGMLDIYLSNINIRTNEIMKFLTVVSTIFVPLTFITGLYGMNFEIMPELTHTWGYPIVLLVMAAMAGSMLVYFRRKNWI